MLGETVVVAGDGAGTDVGRGADLTVPEVGEVVRLRPATDLGFLGLDEVADVHRLGEDGSGADVRERSDGRLVPDLALGEYDAEAEVDAVAERRVTEKRGTIKLTAAPDDRTAE